MRHVNRVIETRPELYLRVKEGKPNLVKFRNTLFKSKRGDLISLDRNDVEDFGVVSVWYVRGKDRVYRVNSKYFANETFCLAAKFPIKHNIRT